MRWVTAAVVFLLCVGCLAQSVVEREPEAAMSAALVSRWGDKTKTVGFSHNVLWLDYTVAESFGQADMAFSVLHRNTLPEYNEPLRLGLRIRVYNLDGPKNLIGQDQEQVGYFLAWYQKKNEQVSISAKVLWPLADTCKGTEYYSGFELDELSCMLGQLAGFSLSAKVAAEWWQDKGFQWAVGPQVVRGPLKAYYLFGSDEDFWGLSWSTKITGPNLKNDASP
jgi:hypothetical protein